MNILDGKKLRDEIFLKLKDKVKDLKLSLAVIQVGDDEASNVYINQKKKMCENLIIQFKHYRLQESILDDEVIHLIEKLNKDDTTAILMQLPIPNHLNKQKIIDSIDYRKDVDGLTSINAGNLLLGKKGLIPCTPKGIITLLKYNNIDLKGKRVTIIGRSNLVGKPLALLMLRENATVSICHSKTKNIKDITLNSDIIISATGKNSLVKEDMIKDNAVVVDVGISKIDGKLFGDVDFEQVSRKCSYITPVPGGVGPMTIASLAENIYEAYLIQKK